jgi:predicted dehydrogenase/nucleoside-diphosphate-sugar epimerase
MISNEIDLLKVGIVGCGNIANLQLRYIKKYINPERIALCDKNDLRLAWLSEEHGITTTFSDLDDMLENFKPDLVHVLTPPKSHKDIAIQCMQAGCHVFLEKPMCVSVQEAQEVVDAANRHNRLVCIDHLRLFDPQFLKAKRILESGALGDIVSISTREVENYITRKGEGLAAKWMEDLPGEIFYDILPHHLCMINAFLPGLSVKGVEYRSDGNGTPKELLCILSSSEGSGIIHLSLAGHIENHAKFECTKGVVVADFLNRMTVVRKSTPLPGIIDRLRDKVSESLQLMGGTINLVVKRPDNLAGMDATIRNFYEALEKSGNSPVPPTDGVIVARVSEDIFGGALAGEREAAIRETDAPWPAIKPKTPGKRCDVLVTGGTGFIGRRLVGRLLSMGACVRVLSHREHGDDVWSSYSDRIEVFKGNISNPVDVERACKGVTSVYHLAAATKGPWLYHLDTTVAGTQNIVDACSKYPIESLVYISTIGILNATALGRRSLVDEDASFEQKPTQRGNYAKAKLMAEMTVRRFMDEPGNVTRVNIIRPGIVYGPGKHPLMGIVQGISKGVSISLEYKKRILPLVYVDNLLDALELAGNSEASGIYNVVDSGQITTEEFVEAFKKETGEKFGTIFLPRPILWSVFWLLDRMSMMLRGKPSFWVYNLKAKGCLQQYSSKRIENRLGWFSRVGMKQALRESMD